jgi:hypothetical protein
MIAPSPAKINLETVTFCSGFWYVPENRKYNQQHYLDLLPNTIAMIENGYLLFFYDDENFFSLCKTYAQRHNVKLVGIQMSLTEIPYFELGDSLLRSCKAMNQTAMLSLAGPEKGVIHYNRDYLESGEESYKKVSTIWMCRIPLVTRRAIAINPFSTSRFAWIDISISRLNNWRSNWNFIELRYNKNRKIYHYPSLTMTYCGKPLRVIAGFLCGDREAWATLDPLFERYLFLHLGDAYAHDSETILNFIVNDHPGLFSEIPTSRL